MNPDLPYYLCFNDPDLATRIATLGLPLALFLAGLAGSAVHCLGMCGPFVLGQVAGRAEIVAGGYGELQRLKQGALLPYHLGRVTTYAALGAAAGLAGRAFLALPGLRMAAAVLLLLAALALIAQALPAVGRALPAAPTLPGLGRIVVRLAGRVAGPQRRDALSLWCFGLLLGFLPCGFLWGALAASSAAGGPAGGAAAMAGFGLGTVPVLVGLGWGGALFGRRTELLKWLAIPLQLLNALFLAWMAARIVAGV